MVMDEGWIKVYRKTLQSRVWKRTTAKQKAVIFTLLLMATHTEQTFRQKGEIRRLTPGQIFTSYERIRQAVGDGISIREIRTALSIAETCQFLTKETTKAGQLITICNYASYQGKIAASDKVTDKEATKRPLQQAEYKQVTAPKNDKNVFNVLDNIPYAK